MSILHPHTITDDPGRGAGPRAERLYGSLGWMGVVGADAGSDTFSRLAVASDSTRPGQSGGGSASTLHEY